VSCPLICQQGSSFRNTFATRFRSPSCASSTASRGRLATSGSTATCGRGRRGSSSARVGPGVRPMPRSEEIVAAILEEIATGSGTLTSGPGGSAARASGTCGLRMSTGSSIVDMCNPCPRTLLLPISPTAQLLIASCSAVFLQDFPDRAFGRPGVSSFKAQKRQPHRSDTVRDSSGLRVDLKSRPWTMKIDVKPHAVFVWIWDARCPPASPGGLMSVIAVRDLKLVRLQVLSN
jgi:hypothetical protein